MLRIRAETAAMLPAPDAIGIVALIRTFYPGQKYPGQWKM